MKQLQKKLLILFTGLSVSVASLAQGADTSGAEQVVTFRFLPGKDMFFLRNNETALERLYTLIDEYRGEISGGKMPVYVDGYCASLPASKENLRTAFLRSNRVKSELIVRKGVKEADFVTSNHADVYNGDKDVVVVTLHIPVKKEPPVVKEEPKTEIRKETPPEPRPTEEAKTTEPTREPVSEIVPASAESAQTYRFAVRTNILYDAMLLPTLGVEWRINPDWGVKLDGSLAGWSGGTGKTMKVWLLNPEVRWYLLRDRRFYAGVSANFGKYNLYKYPLGCLFSKDTGYQGSLWSAGLTVGYQLPLSRNFSFDFNLGLGYTRSSYDSFGMADDVRVYKNRDKTKNFFGPTQAGINLIWTIGGHK